MSTTQSTFQTVTCDGPNCKKSELLEVTDQAAIAKKVTENPWLKNLRNVLSAGKRGADGQPIQYNFCSDTCLVDAATAGLFIPDEEKKIIPPDGNANAQIRQMLEEKARTAAADVALRRGDNIQISEKKA
jgi:hypothetical protein